MNDNTLLCIVACIAIAGCSTCRVSGDWRAIEGERIKSTERIELMKGVQP